MGAQTSKATAKEKEEATGRGQKFQFTHNFWPEPIREAGTTHDSSEHSNLVASPGGVAEYIGTSQRDGHKFDTMVAAISVEEAPSSRLFLYGKARFEGDESRAEIMCLKINPDGTAADSMLRYTDYFACDAGRLVDASSLDNEELQGAATLRAELTSAPTDPNDDDRKVRMQKALNGLIDQWKDSPPEESALKSRVAKLPWKRKCAGDALEKAVAQYCTEDCTISMPLQQIVVKANDLPTQWRARLKGEGIFTQFGQTEVSLTSEAYAGHHPTGFAQIVIYSCDVDTTGQHHLSNGVLVAEFDKEGNKIEKLVIFRDFLSESERASVLKA